MKLLSNKNSFLSNIVRVLFANFWVTIVGFIGGFIFPRILTIEAYALYHTFTLYISYIGILHLGFPSGMVINYAGKNHNDTEKSQYKAEIVLLLSILSFFTAVFMIIFALFRNPMIFYIATAVLPIGIIGSYKSLYQTWSKFKEYTRISVFITTSIPILALVYYLISKDLPGEIYIIIYLLVNWVVALFILIKEIIFVGKAKRNRIFTRQNWDTEKTGLALVVGNYINVLFVSADKQFVKWFFETTEFAYYSFAMSMQSLMTVFITSVAQPLFPTMAQGKIKDSDYNRIKEVLFVFGSFSGCAYFVLSIIVKLFIQKYIGSLEIIGIYFIVFPAMAVVNCLYINLYKIKGMMKSYIYTLAGILATAILLNMLFIWKFQHFTGVALATAITYYVWLAIGFVQFRFIKFTFKDAIYLACFFIGFFVITQIENDYLGFLIYFLFVCGLAFACYRKELMYFIKRRNRKEQD